MKTLLFLNGEPPKTLPELDDFQIIACVDGAFHYLRKMDFPLEKLDFVSGDFDSYTSDELRTEIKFIHTPDQSKTDFEKCLQFLIEKGATQVEIYGGSGREQDHFLGNLSIAYKYKDAVKLKFCDEFSDYFFANKSEKLDNIKGKMISLYPYPMVEGLTTKGLHWELENATMMMLQETSLRNYADKDSVFLEFSSGVLLIFVGKYLYRK